MPDFKCVACRIRLRSPVGDRVPRPCPVCEAPLEPVDELSEVVGFRSLQPHDAEIEERFADRVSDLTERREARIEELRVAAERWLDEGGSFDTEAVAAALDPPAWTER
jgi:hypothetical protein